MNKFFIVLGHTFFSKLKTKSFIITTVIMIGLIYLFANFSNIIDYFNKDAEDKKIAVLDESGQIFEMYEQHMTAVGSNVNLIKYDGHEKDAVKDVEEGKFIGLLVISTDEDNLPIGKYKALTVTDSMISFELEGGLQQVKTSLSAMQMNLTEEQLNKIYEPVEFEKIALSEHAKTEEELNEARGLVYVLLFVIYFAVIMYASMIATEVATEKSSRVMEILISSVSPITQMFAKIIGIALLGLTQICLLLIVGYSAIKKNLQSLDEGFFSYMGFGNIPTSTIVYAVVFFILGYLLYATMAALLGSLVSRIEDVNQFIMPMTFLIVIGFLIAVFGLSNPDTSFITITSYIPFFTPMIMFLRVGMLNIPTWEIVLGIGLLIATIIVLAIFGARVYRGGVLMYGKAGSIKDIFKAIQLTKKE